MSPEAFLIVSAAFFLSLDPGLELGTPRWTAVLQNRFFEALEIFFHAALLIVFYERLRTLLKVEETKTFFPLFYMLGAYALTLLRGKDARFLMLSWMTGLFFTGSSLGLPKMIQNLACIASASGVSALLLLCAQRRLVFSRVPAAVKGLPLAFLLAALLALVLASLEGLLGF